MSSPKYSIVLPTLNGAETLCVTVPEILKSDRDDFELIISNNHSDDNTKEIIESLLVNDPRLKLVEPPQRLPLGKHLDFAYQQAQGEWQGHLGDDDIIFPSRFDILDQVIASSNVQVIRGEYVRYHWPNFIEAKLANTLDGRTYTGKVIVKQGSELAKQLLNETIVYGGGSWVVHRDIINKVRERCGYFSSPQHVEFFAMRAACTISDRVALLDLPIWVIGRHSKSAGTQGLGKKRKNSTWDWSFEDPQHYEFFPFQYKGYVSISHDAALAVKTQFPEILGDTDINWLPLIDAVANDLKGLIENGQLPPEAEQIFAKGFRHLPLTVQAKWLILNKFKLKRIVSKLYNLTNQKGQSFTADPKNSDGCFGWPHYLCGSHVGIESIVDVPKWVEHTFFGFFDKI
jgi:glycosyltransferase involved in cell wall biosynthesis